MPVTLKLPLPPHLTADEFSRADLEFRGVDHSGPSFEARIYLNNPAADSSSGRDAETGYAGSFHVFGHGGCFGEAGHCAVPAEPRSPYDYRPPHQLTPQLKTVVVTDAVKRLLAATNSTAVTVTVVAVVSDNRTSQVRNVTDPLRFESVSLIAREDPSAAGIPLPAPS